MSHKVFRVLDKLDKIGIDSVVLELTKGRVDASGDKIPGVGLKDDQVSRINDFMRIPSGKRNEVIRELQSLLKGEESSAGPIGELQEICNTLEALAIPEENVVLDPSIARGLDYYTGPVFEARLDDAPEFGSVFGGGRYDGLVERFLGKNIPAVGASIGVDRLFAALQKLNLVDLAPSTAQVIVMVMEADKGAEYQKITRELREAGINTELYLGTEKGLGKQLQYANRQQIPVAVIIGSNEFEKGEVTIKNLRMGARLQETKAVGQEREEWLKASKGVQVTVARAQMLSHIRSMLETA
jgi:histidyl-tRNA synthetase